LLSNSDVIDVLDQHGGLSVDKSIHVLNEDPYKTVEREVILDDALFEKKASTTVSFKRTDRHVISKADYVLNTLESCNKVFVITKVNI
jgi:hypothetical protein